MKVKELITLLKDLDQEAIIDIASDEEGNSFGDISDSFAEGKLAKTKQKVYSLYPERSELPEERFVIDEVELQEATKELEERSTT